MKYVTGYTGFSGDPALQKGNYLALKASSVSGATITAELIGGNDGPKALDSDGIALFRIADVNTQKVKIVATKNGETATAVYGLRMMKAEKEA